MVAAVAGEHGIAERVEQVLRHRNAGGDADEGADKTGGRGRGVLTHGMTRRDVTDLVSEYRGELGLGVKVGENAAGDVDVTARERKRVDLRTVEYREVVSEAGAMALRCELLSDRCT